MKTESMPSVDVIAEAEINHNGDVEIARKLVEAAKAAGADYVKFQCFVAEGFVSPTSPFFDIFRQNELTFDEFRMLKSHADAVGIEMVSTAGDLDGLRYIVDLDLPAVKVGSTNITNTGLLKVIAESGKPVWLSSGASYLSEVAAAVELLESHGAGPITLFHCTVQYPADAANLNLRALTTLKALFPNLEIAYSDHSLGTDAAKIAVALGATKLEKHFTLDTTMEGPDHGFSSDPEAMKDYIAAVRLAEEMLGRPGKKPAECERNIRLLGRRFLTAMADIPKGAAISASDIRPRRVKIEPEDADKYLPPMMEEKIVGWSATRTISAGDGLLWTDVAAGT